MGVALALFTHSPHVNQQVIGVGLKSNEEYTVTYFYIIVITNLSGEYLIIRTPWEVFYGIKKGKFTYGPGKMSNKYTDYIRGG